MSLISCIAYKLSHRPGGYLHERHLWVSRLDCVMIITIFCNTAIHQLKLSDTFFDLKSSVLQKIWHCSYHPINLKEIICHTRLPGYGKRVSFSENIIYHVL
jgi:hypothetical protein